MDFLNNLLPNVAPIWDEVWIALGETIYMTLATALIGGTLGLLLGIVLLVTDANGLAPRPTLYSILDKAVNIFRSLPFVIIIAILVSFTRFVVGTTIGSTAAIVPLVVSTVPFFARQVQNALLEVDPGVIEAAHAMGTSKKDIIFRVYLKEGLASLIRVASVTMISIVGLTALAGIVGGGGLGNMAIARGYNRYQGDVILVCTILILIIVFISQGIGNYLAKKVSH